MRQFSIRFNVLLAGFAQVFLAVTPVCAQYVGPAAQSSPAVNVPFAGSSVSSVKQALTAADDTYVTLEGYIINKLKHEHYTFSDTTGQIEVELDDKRLPPGQPINSKTRVHIVGEIDRHFQRPNTIDVKHIEIVPQEAGQ